MNQRDKDILLVAFAVGFFVLVIVVLIGLHFLYSQAKLDKCKSDCDELGMQYWKFEDSLFGKDSCLCVDKPYIEGSGKPPKEIW